MCCGTCLNQAGWKVDDPPYVIDHEQNVLQLVTVDEKTPDRLLQDAWCQHVARRTKHKTMNDLVGMNPMITLS